MNAEASNKQPPVLEANQLGVRLGTYQALKELSFSVAKGDFVAVVGPNGAGKSTLLSTLLGLQKHVHGELRVLGKEAKDADPGKIGYVPQIKTLDRRFPAQALELVVSGMRQRWPGRVAESERRAALDALKATGAEHLATRAIGELSGGELQRVYLARCLVKKPDLVLLDEPATGIDAIGEADMFLLLETMQKETGMAVVMVTHDWYASCHHCHKVLLLNRVQLGFGDPMTVLSEDNLRRAFGHIGHTHAMNVKEAVKFHG